MVETGNIKFLENDYDVRELDHERLYEEQRTNIYIHVVFTSLMFLIIIFCIKSWNNNLIILNLLVKFNEKYCFCWRYSSKCKELRKVKEIKQRRSAILNVYIIYL